MRSLIEIVEGDLLTTENNLILHQVNCQGKMNSGVAKQIRNKYPQVYNDYLRHYNNVKDKEELLGKISATEVNESQYVVNMFSQFNYGYEGNRYTNYEAIYRCLEKVSVVAEQKGFSVALPYNIGCDRGGANWNIVYSMVNELFKNIKTTIYKFKGEV